jgi:hypothetical protein
LKRRAKKIIIIKIKIKRKRKRKKRIWHIWLLELCLPGKEHGLLFEQGG